MLVLTGPAEVVGDRELPYRRNVVVSCERIPEGQTPDAYVAQQLAVFSKNMEGFRQLATSEIEIAGQTCPLIEAQALGPGGALYRQLITYVLRPPLAYALSGSHLLGPQFDAARDEYLAMFSSFEVVS